MLSDLGRQAVCMCTLSDNMVSNIVQYVWFTPPFPRIVSPSLHAPRIYVYTARIYIYTEMGYCGTRKPVARSSTSLVRLSCHYRCLLFACYTMFFSLRRIYIILFRVNRNWITMNHYYYYYFVFRWNRIFQLCELYYMNVWFEDS